MKKKKTSWSARLFTMLVYMLMGGFLATGFLHTPLVEKGSLLTVDLVLLLVLYIVFYAQLVIHEGGHLIFGLLSGYHFCSFRIGSFALVRMDGKLCLRKMKLAGTGGQCLMDPPDLIDDNLPVILYNLGGVLMNLLTAFLSLALSRLMGETIGAGICRAMAAVGIGIALTNGVPMKVGGLSNDGRNAWELRKDSKARYAFWAMMKVNAEQTKGIRLRDMPSAWMKLPTEQEIQNGITAAMGVLYCGRLMDDHRFAEADAAMERLLAMDSGISGLHRAMMISDRIFLERIGENRPEVIAAMLTKEQKKMMKALKALPQMIRVFYGEALLGEHNPQKAEKLKAAFEKTAAKYTVPGEICLERELMAMAEEKAKS